MTVLVPAGQAGYVEFLPRFHDQIAEHFGDDLEEAERRVDEINESVGLGREEALAVVGRSMDLQNRAESGR
jgi:hypothetical protein